MNITEQMLTPDRIIALASSIAAFLAAFATLLTVIEMRRQRVSSYKPDLVFGESKFSVFETGKPGHPVFTMGQKSAEDMQREIWEGRWTSIKLRFYNVGIGSAKKIKATCSTDIKQFINIVKEEDCDNSIDIVFDKRNSLLTIKRDGKESGNVINQEITTTIDYILPASVTSDLYEITIPHFYENLYMLFFGLVISKDYKSKAFDLLSLVPPLFIEFVYNDIENNEIKKRFKIKPTFVVLLNKKYTNQIEKRADAIFEIEEV